MLEELTVMTYNVAHDLEYCKDIEPWEERIRRASKRVVKKIKPSIIGLQEVLGTQQGTGDLDTPCIDYSGFEMLDFIVRHFRNDSGIKYKIAYAANESEGGSQRQGSGLCYQQLLSVILYDPKVVEIDKDLLPPLWDGYPQTVCPLDSLYNPVLCGPQAGLCYEGRRILFSGVVFYLKQSPEIHFFAYNTHSGKEYYDDMLREIIERQSQIVNKCGSNNVMPPIVFGDFNAIPTETPEGEYISWKSRFKRTGGFIDSVYLGEAKKDYDFQWFCKSIGLSPRNFYSNPEDENHYIYSDDHPIYWVRIEQRPTSVPVGINALNIQKINGKTAGIFELTAELDYEEAGDDISIEINNTETDELIEPIEDPVWDTENRIYKVLIPYFNDATTGQCKYVIRITIGPNQENQLPYYEFRHYWEAFGVFSFHTEQVTIQQVQASVLIQESRKSGSKHEPDFPQKTHVKNEPLFIHFDQRHPHLLELPEGYDLLFEYIFKGIPEGFCAVNEDLEITWRVATDGVLFIKERRDDWIKFQSLVGGDCMRGTFILSFDCICEDKYGLQHAEDSKDIDIPVEIYINGIIINKSKIPWIKKNIEKEFGNIVTGALKDQRSKPSN